MLWERCLLMAFILRKPSRPCQFSTLNLSGQRGALQFGVAIGRDFTLTKAPLLAATTWGPNFLSQRGQGLLSANCCMAGGSSCAGLFLAGASSHPADDPIAGSTLRCAKPPL